MLPYKKILLDLDTERVGTRLDQVNYENALKNLETQINELKDSNKSNDNLDNVLDVNNLLEEKLDQALNNCTVKQINKLLKNLNNAINDKKYNLNVGESVQKLKELLEQKQLDRSFDIFEEKIVNNKLQDLNSLDDEIPILVEWLKEGKVLKNKAIPLLNKMDKALESHPEHFRHTDVKYFYMVRGALVTGYPKELWGDKKTALEAQTQIELGEIFNGKTTAKDLARIVSDYTNIEQWDWAALGDDTTLQGEVGTIKPNDFVSKFNEINQARIDWVKDELNKLFEKMALEDLTYKEGDGGVITFIKEKKTVDIFALLNNENLEKLNILNSEELNSEHFKGIKDSLVNDLKNRIEEKEQKERTQVNNNSEEFSSRVDKHAVEYINHAAGNNKFMERKEDGSYSYNLTKAKAYLATLKDKRRDDFKILRWNEEKAWIAAVQIVLNNVWWNEHKIPVDGLKWRKTEEALKKYQKTHGLTPDGQPGPKTIWKLIEEHLIASTQSEYSKTYEAMLRDNNFTKIDQFENANNFWINEKLNFYKKSGDDEWYYYFNNEEFIRVSTEDPWLVRSMNVSAFWGSTDAPFQLNNMVTKLNVCNAWKDALSKKLTLEGWSFKVKEKDGQNIYIFDNWDKKIYLWESILVDDFLGKNNIEDKLKLINLAADCLNTNWGKIKDIANNNISFDNTNAGLSLKEWTLADLYWLGTDQRSNFMNYFNNFVIINNEYSKS